MQHEIIIAGTGERYACREQESVLEGMLRLGRRGIPQGCRGGGCGVCKVRIAAGDYQARAMSRTHISSAEEGDGVVLACRVRPQSDLVLEVIGRLHKNICAQRRGAVAVRDQD